MPAYPQDYKILKYLLQDVVPNTELLHLNFPAHQLEVSLFAFQ